MRTHKLVPSLRLGIQLSRLRLALSSQYIIVHRCQLKLEMASRLADAPA
jgi:hypothetical protein